MVMTAASPLFIDTNVLIYAKSSLAPLHTVSFSTLQSQAQQGAELWSGRQTLREYLSGMTRPSTFPGMHPSPVSLPMFARLRASSALPKTVHRSRLTFSRCLEV